MPQYFSRQSDIYLHKKKKQKLLQNFTRNTPYVILIKIQCANLKSFITSCDLNYFNIKTPDFFNRRTNNILNLLLLYQLSVSVQI